MKKKIIFLIMIMTLLAIGKTVHAEEYSFYEAEYLDNMYMNKYQYATNTIYYQRARFFQNRQTYQIAYCIEPLNFFQEGSVYFKTDHPSNLTKEQMDQIEKIAYFGYRYKNHFDASWYAVAQLMIWRVASPTEGDYYFTKTLNGERTNEFDYQIDEINQLIYEYDHEIPIENQTITVIQGTKSEIEIGESLQKYSTNNSEIELVDTRIIIPDLEEGEYDITLTREKDIIHNGTIEFFESATSQNMVHRGDLEPKQVQFKINVISNHIHITKVDEDTKETEPQGEASLDGAIYETFNEEGESIDSIEIINNQGEIKDIPFGTYYLQETVPGKGYELNNEKYTFTLSEENPNYEITVSNAVIKKKITIQKVYGEENKIEPETNIQFEIINSNNEVIETVETNEQGEVEITLPYGTYTIKQVNTTEGYQMIEPFQIIISNQEEETITLYDYKIPVPNTKKERNLLEIIIQFIRMILC